MKKIKCIYAYAILILLLSGCETRQEIEEIKSSIKNNRNSFLYNMIPEDGEKEITTDYARAVNSTSVTMLHTILSDERHKSSNVVFSPFSLTRNLSVLAEGASETAKNELLTFLGGETVLHDAKKALTELLYADNTVVFQSADMLYYDTTRFTLIDSFRDTVTSKYGVEITGSDFADKNAVCSQINTWVEKNTAGYIKDFLSPDAIDENSAGFLYNALYFKAAWASPFDIKKTETETFHAPSEDVKVKMMKSDMIHILTLTEDSTHARIYYGKSNKDYFYLDLYMPEADTSLETFSEERLKELLDDKMTPSVTGQIQLPKFNFTTVTDIAELMKSLGVTEIFDKTKNPLPGIFNKTSDLDSFFVKSIRQKSGITTDEEGTTAYTVTESAISMEMAAEPHSAIFNRPFIFLIRAGSNGLILFTGAVQNPLEH